MNAHNCEQGDCEHVAIIICRRCKMYLCVHHKHQGVMKALCPGEKK